MGGGLAKQISDQYPEVEKEYREFCQKHNCDYERLKGKVYLSHTENKIIANCFSQKPNFDTDYEAMKSCFEQIKGYADQEELSLAMPYKIGCGIANGDWIIVRDIIENIFIDYDITLYKLEQQL